MMHRINMFGGRLHQREGEKTESIVLRSCLLGILIRERAHTGATQPRSTRFGTTNHFVTLFVHLFSRIGVGGREENTLPPWEGGNVFFFPQTGELFLKLVWHVNFLIHENFKSVKNA